MTVERPELGQSNSFIIKGGVRNESNEVQIGSMFRAYHDADDLTKDSGVEYKGKIYNQNNLVNKGYVDAADDAQDASIDALQDSVAILQKEVERLGQVVNQAVPYKLIKERSDTAAQLRDGGFYFGDCPNGNLLEITDDWSGICFLYADTADLNSDFADFGPDTLDEGDLIEGISRESDGGYFLVEVGAVGGYDEGAGKKIAAMEVRLIKASGVPGPNGGEYALTAFRLSAAGGIDLPTADERYVEKAGDTMTGELVIDRNKLNGSAMRIAGDGGYDNPNMILWNSGAISTKYENFKNSELVTKKYVTDNTVAADRTGLRIYGQNKVYYIEGL